MLYFFIFGLSFLAGCDKHDAYEKGYESAWQDEEEPGFFASEEEKEGYADGLDDAWMYDEGFYDGKKKNPVKYYNKYLPECYKNEDYMDGYRDGKKYR